MSFNVQGRYLTCTIPVFGKDDELIGHKVSTVAYAEGVDRIPDHLRNFAIASAKASETVRLH